MAERESAAVFAKSLTKTYNTGPVPVHAVREVDLSIQNGEFVAVIGPSGCGKSTLLHLLGGLDRPTSGEVHLAGARIDTLGEAQRSIMRRRQVGFVFQFFNLIGNLTVADNIELPALMAGASPRDAQAEREALLDELGISDKADSFPNQLSGGEQQRVATARALINHPTLLLADEPTGNLNHQRAISVLKMLQEYNGRGQTVLLVTHDARVASMADRVLFMRDGSFKDEAKLDRGADAKSVLSRLIDLGG